ncbi:MAG: hypothetical protein KBT10_08775 [Bacteroidales bacterium]|nr:hypothetical protein [Candidatus Sodaliphilus aphodohippi]
MKRILLFAAMLLGTVATYAQTDDYIPLVREGSEWCYWSYSIHGPKDNNGEVNHDLVYSFYKIQGDSILDSRTYKKLLLSRCYIQYDQNGVPFMNKPLYQDNWLGIFGLMREEGHRVYALYGNLAYKSGWGGLFVDTVNEGTREVLMYDFDDLNEYYRKVSKYNGGDTTLMSYLDTIPDSNILGTNKSYRLSYEYYDGCFVAEGIGQYSHDRKLMSVDYRLHPFNDHDSRTTEYLSTLVYMKNPQGEFEYLDEELYNKIKDVVETPSAVTDVTVTKPADNRYYNLMGQPVAHPENAPGIYIHNGKKVVVK